MKASRWVGNFSVLAIVVAVILCAGSVVAAPNVMKGDVWVIMNQDQKVAYILGAGDVVDVEWDLMQKVPELKRENFSAKAVEALANTATNDIIAKVDQWYQANGDKLDTPVLLVIWNTMIKPNVKTGIAGRPLQ
jgi:hypothetical protein